MKNALKIEPLSEEKWAEIVRNTYALRTEALISAVALRRNIYRQVAAYGHVGRTDVDLP